MTSHTTRRFRELFASLPANVQRQAREAYKPFRRNTRHPGLRFNQVHADAKIFPARVGIEYRAVCVVEGDCAIWFWIGAHADYVKLLSTLLAQSRPQP